MLELQTDQTKQFATVERGEIMQVGSNYDHVISAGQKLLHSEHSNSKKTHSVSLSADIHASEIKLLCEYFT